MQTQVTAEAFLVWNSNCAVIGIVIPFTAIQAKFGTFDQISVVTVQAVSEAVYVVPRGELHGYSRQCSSSISGEEVLSQRIFLGPLNADAITSENQTILKISAACIRIPVLDGHTACVF